MKAENGPSVDNAKAQMKKGVLELCIMATLAGGEAYASDIIEQLREHELLVVEGTMYPLLNRLKNAGLLSYSWQESAAGPPRKYYLLTPEGEVFLRELLDTWNSLVNVVNQTTKSLN